MSTDTEREELSDILYCRPFPYGGSGSYMRPDANASYAMAKVILSAGYRKQRTITTREELHALPNDAVIRGRGSVYEHDRGRFHCTDGGTVDASLVSLPVDVLYEPEPTP